MATPTRSQPVSTPKPHLPSTPIRMMASPRPGPVAPSQKPIAHKSPAVRTPASAHGHTHATSLSSQPSTTPLAAAAIHDELMALNSPATALLNSIVPSGLTPITSDRTGLGISSHGHTDLPLPTADQISKDPEAQRLLRLQEALGGLKSKALGRDITRESVERVARLNGFEALWDEDNLTIAGNIVEIDVNFDSVVDDEIVDLVLKLNSADGDSHVQKEASLVLKHDLGLPHPPEAQDLTSFSRNIDYLAKMDHLGVSPNAFEIINNLSVALRSIWEEEKQQTSWRSWLQQARKSAIGDVRFNHIPRLGLHTLYWPMRPQGGNKGRQRSSGCMATIACEAGPPGISASQTWLQPEILKASEDKTPLWNNELLQTALDHAVESKEDGPGGSNTPVTLDIHFACELEPDVLLPINVAMNLNTQVTYIPIDQSRVTTYQAALQKFRNDRTSATLSDTIENHWSRRLPCLSESGNLAFVTHSYALYSASQSLELWTVPVSKVTFNHPKKLAAVLSVFRQYALLWTMLESLLRYPALPPTSNVDSWPHRNKVIKRRSNKDASPNITNHGAPFPGRDHSLPIDISIDVFSDPSVCRIDVFTPISANQTGSSGRAFVHLSICIGLNGTISVDNVDGVKARPTDVLKTKLGKMLEATEDIGIVVQWLIDKENEEQS